MDVTEFSIPRIFTLNNPTILRIFPPLAEEIGLNESIILLQIDFLISISRNRKKQPLIRDGMAWTRQSLRELKDNWLPFWSPQTIARALWKLRDEQHLIFVSDKYNEHNYDKSQWFALNPQGFGQLTSVTLHMVQLNGTGLFQIGTALSQDGTTIPEIPLDLLEGTETVRELASYKDLLNQVMACCKMRNILTLDERDYVAIDKLYAMEITPETLNKHYGRQGQGWWWTVYWKGRSQAQFPLPNDLVKTVGQAMAFEDEKMEVPQRKRRKKRDKDADDYLRDNPRLAEAEEDFRL